MTSIKKNYIYNLAYQILINILPLITTPYLSRALGAEKIGTYSYSYTIAGYFVMFAMLGLNNYGNREIAFVRNTEEKLAKKFWSIYAMQILFSAVAIGAYAIYTICNKENVSMNTVMLIYVCSSAFDVNWFLFGMEKFKMTVTRNLSVKVVTILLIFLYVKTPDDLVKYALIMTGGMMISQLIVWPFIFKEVGFCKIQWADVVQHIKPNLILFIPVLAVSIYKMMDKIMLGYLTTYTEVGYYESVEKVLAIPICCINALGTVMLPRMSNLLQRKDVKKEKYYFNHSLILSVFVSIPMALGLVAVADVFVPFFYGEGYDPCVKLFYWLMPSSIFVAFASVIRTQYLIPHKKDTAYIVSVVLGAVVNLIGNMILIPRMQSVGAAISTLLAECIVCMSQIYSIKEKDGILSVTKHSLGFLIPGIVMVGVVRVIPIIYNLGFSILSKIGVGVIVYLVGAILYYKIFLKKALDVLNA